MELAFPSLLLMALLVTAAAQSQVLPNGRIGGSASVAGSHAQRAPKSNHPSESGSVVRNGSASYTFTTISYPGAGDTVAQGINTNGDITGSFFGVTAAMPFSYIGGVFAEVQYPGSVAGQGYGINDSDQIVGFFIPSIGSSDGFLYSDGSYSTVGPQGTGQAAFGINNAGDIVGEYVDSNGMHGFDLQSTGYTTLDYPGYKNTYATGVNNLGEIVGNYGYGSGHAFLYSNGTWSNLWFPGAINFYPTAINDYAEVVGEYTDANYQDHGFLYSNGVYSTIDIPDVYTYLNAINNSGQIVGFELQGTSEEVGFIGSLPSGVSTSLSASTLSFGDQTVNVISPAQRMTLTDTGAAPLDISSIVASSQFLVNNSCGSTLGPGASCTLSVAFEPTSMGPKSGTVTISDNAAGSPQVISLSGTGTLVSLSPPSLSFGNQKVGTTSSPQTVLLTNVSTNNLTISSIRETRKDYRVSSNCGSFLPPKSSCTITVTFTPVTTGDRSGTLNVGDSGGGSPQTVGLTGTGTN